LLNATTPIRSSFDRCPGARRVGEALQGEHRVREITQREVIDGRLDGDRDLSARGRTAIMAASFGVASFTRTTNLFFSF
jgi:phage FluMu protein gp41